MVRRTGGGVPEASVGRAGGDPPPSTLAAKIVDSRSNAKARQQPEGKELFAKLLQEYLNDPAIEEANLETNAKLVLVVAEAGLDTAFRDDPFSQGERIEQARDSIAVIKLTIQRVPSLILYAEPSDSSVASLPVFLILFPKVIALLGRPHLEAIHKDATELLTTSLTATRSDFGTWASAKSISEAVFDTLEDAVIALETQVQQLGCNSTVSSIDLPSQRVIAALCPDFQDAIVFPRGSQAHIGTYAQAAYVAIGLAMSLSVATPPERHVELRLDEEQLRLLDYLERVAVSLIAILRRSQPSTRIRSALTLLCHTVSTIMRTGCGSTTSCGPSNSVLGILCTILHYDVLSSDKGLQQSFAQLLMTTLLGVQDHGNWTTLADAQLSTVLTRIINDQERSAALNVDLQCVLSVAATFCSSEVLPQVSFTTPARPQPNLLDMKDERLRDALSALNVQHVGDNNSSDTRPAKRRRTEDYTPLRPINLDYGAFISDLTTRAGLEKHTSLSGIEQELIHKLKTADPPVQETLIASMAVLPCCLAASLSEIDLTAKSKVCDICNINRAVEIKRLPATESKPYERVLTQLVEWSGLQRTKKSRLLVMLAVQIFINHHAGNPEVNDIGISPLGQWCLKSLHSSFRELRIVAGRCMAAFVCDKIPESTRRTNSNYCLTFLKALGERNNPSEKETLMLAWGQVARRCDYDELNIALLELVEGLGAAHPLICSVAYEEIERCAEYRRLSIDELFRPYWRTIAVAVIKDFRTKPQKLHNLCDLLSINNVSRFLLQTQADTIPYLVMTRDHEVLRRIASARNVAIKDIFLQPPKHLGLTLATLLLHHTTEPERTIMELLCDAAPEFKTTDLASLVRLEPITTVCEMFKAAGDAGSTKTRSISQAIKTFVALAERRPGQNKSTGRSTKLLADFLDDHIFGILTRFSDVLDAPSEVHAMAEKRRCLRAIKEMIVMAKAHFDFTVAGPQIKACLQSALQGQGLWDDAFQMWHVFAAASEPEDLDDLLEYTFAIIISKWDHFSDSTRSIAHQLVAHQIKVYNNLVREKILYLPSFGNIPLFAKYEGEIQKFKQLEPLTKRLEVFSARCASQNPFICELAASELLLYLDQHQRAIHDLAYAPEAHPAVVNLIHALMDATTRFSTGPYKIGDMSAQCLGVIGCVDVQELNVTDNKEQIVVLSNFDRVSETVDFVAFLLEHVLVKAFHSASNSRVQNYLAWAMQELLKHCDFQSVLTRSKSSQPSPQSQRWSAMSELARNTLLPFFSTKYMLNRSADTKVDAHRREAIFKHTKSHSEWLRELVFDLLQRGRGENVMIFFPVLSKVIIGHDLSIASFLLPYVATNVMLAGNDHEKLAVQHELLVILETKVDNLGSAEAENVKKASENVFQVLDYMSRWLQRKRKQLNDARLAGARGTVNSLVFDEMKEISYVSSIEQVFEGIPADVIARRASECRSFSRALYHWESYLREERELGHIAENSEEEQEILSELQQIYTQIDEPDGIEGISAHLQIMEAEPEATVLDYRLHGRWAAAQSWYELELEHRPTDENIQADLLSCFKESSQLNALLRFVDGRRSSSKYLVPEAYSYAVEAAWSLGKTSHLPDLVQGAPMSMKDDFNVGLAKFLLSLQAGDSSSARQQIQEIRDVLVNDLSNAPAASAKSCRKQLLELHALFEVEHIAGLRSNESENKEALLEMLDSRLRLLGTTNSDKQYLLGVRRATMRLSKLQFTDTQLSSLWLTSARLSRKAGLVNVAFEAINHASRLDANNALVEYSRLLWKDGSHKKAIQTLQGAIDGDAFHSYNVLLSNTDLTMATEDQQQKVSNALLAKAQLLAAKWQDQSGQMGTQQLIAEYQRAVRSNAHWEKGHYYLGRFYNKILDSEKILPTAKQSRAFITGEATKLVIDNYIRSIGFGSKYHYQSVPKIITLWLDFGQDVWNGMTASKPAYPRDIEAKRTEFLHQMHIQIKKYVDRVQPYLFYTALPQMISRVGHPNTQVWETLAHIVIRVASHYPRQSLWSLLAIARSTDQTKSVRGGYMLNRLRQGPPKKDRGAMNTDTVKGLINAGQRLTESLLLACEHQVEQRVSHVSLARDLQFHHSKLTPCGLVVPIERTLMAVLPTIPGAAAMRTHKAFPYGDVLIESFLDDVLVLSSLQRPRKLTIRGSDGQLYGLLCKPKDDLRKDQRLMEFNAMIERSLKRDVDASRRQLYIKTYGVVPLNEECGTIEWVDGLKPMRDIIISSYKSKGVRIDYNEVRVQLTEACSNLPKSASVFNDKILAHFKPVLYEWFVDNFPEPEAWYAARLRYARSCAVMSIVGHMLGLGDRHGENVLLESGSGGVFHVDFNCLFDKGLTFEKPERVPFRLTHNMVNAFGACEVEGPFRKSAEVTLKVLRQHEDTLMTIMETFLYDPTADFMGSHKKKKSVPGVPETPTEVLEMVRNKLRGFKHGEKVPLSVEGYVDDLINQAVNVQNLAEMYIGWCAFF